ncbi:TonB-dependent receptor domain-containing protein [Catenovulum maritimum]|uniref:TonB-dependent receptor n=1 Tax=Catenovulum maritimum TaxID=1513271 RepID=A0A0J8GWC8_9ALTE|nr:TonB-dependent receptor [Catenovulum maritimum]KMT67075.1 hypothetical protein XM47_00325 [Catenovulum maritimum]
MINNFKLKAVATAVVTSFMTTPLYAAEETETENDVETIEVTGFRGSLIKAINSKRFADTVTDSIHAEDIGKSTDQNIADALSRITGVTVQEQDGEGTRISVRGAGAHLNQISMNGIALTSGLSGDAESASSDQSVDLSTFSADILGSIDVIKTQSAENDEGSLGASVQLNSIKPLALNKPRRMLEYQGRYNDYSTDYDRKITASVSDKFFDESFGVIVTYSDETQKTRRDETNVNWGERAYRIQDFTASDMDNKVIRVPSAVFDSEAEYLAAQTDNDAFAQEINGKYYVYPKHNYHRASDNYDPNTQILTTEVNKYGMTRESQNFYLNRNQRDRKTLNIGLQYAPSADTDIQLDLSHAKQEVTNDNHSLFMNYAPDSNVPLELDPMYAWRNFNLANDTFERWVGRGTQGNFARNMGVNTIETKVASLNIKQMLTDDLQVNIVAGYSNTVDDNPRNVRLSTATWGTLWGGAVKSTPLSDFQPMGFNCITGSCIPSLGTEFASRDAVTGALDYKPSRFNPRDLHTNHVGGVNFTSNLSDDTAKSLVIDFDWAIDSEHIREVEFGVKRSNRKRDVSRATTQISNSSSVQSSEGEILDLEQIRMQDITLAQFIDNGAFPVNNFLDEIITPSEVDTGPVNAWTADSQNLIRPYKLEDTGGEWINGWPLLSVDKALGRVLGRDASLMRVTPNNSGSNTIEIDTTAAYGQINFEFLDSQLTGNVGVRYVKDEVNSSGFDSIQYYNNVFAIDAHDTINDRQLANMSLPVCTSARDLSFTPNRNSIPADFYYPNHEDFADFDKCYDWRLTHTFNDQRDNTQPSVGNGLLEEYTDPITGNEYQYLNGFAPDKFDGSQAAWDAALNNLQDDPALIMLFDYSPGAFADGLANELINKPTPEQIVTYDSNGMPTGETISYQAPNPNRAGDLYAPAGRGRDTETLRAYLDRSTTALSGKGLLLPDYRVSSRRHADSSYSMFLPSLNLNYAINEQMIARFAISKTMARPRFDSLNPAVRLNESIWDPVGSGSLGNASLVPLESKNLDLSFEWYFNDTGILSATLFYKDMTNFEETVATPYYAKDLRNVTDQTEIDAMEFLIDPSLVDNSDVQSVIDSDCFRERLASNDITDQAFEIKCREFQVQVRRNGKGATIKGLEFGYTHNYDFLPGFLSGLGTQFNYTYSHSESDEEIIETTGQVLKPLPQPHTPKHSANTTVFWEKDGVQLRLAHRYSSMQLINRQLINGASWLDSTSRLDFSSSYKINNTFTVSFQALNLTDDVRRTFFTAQDLRTEDGEVFIENEGNAMEDSSVDTSKTMSLLKTGRQYRIGIRANF